MENRIGQIFTTNEGYKVEIIEALGKGLYKIRFEDGLILENRYYNIVHGKIKNPMKKSVQGVGYFGVGKYKSQVKAVKVPSYRTWERMMQRCYDWHYQLRKPTYKQCSVAPEWHNYQNFAKWFDENHIEGFQLDKDILIKGNKVYRPEACCFVPQEINGLFIKPFKVRDLPIGVYFRNNKYRAVISKYDKKYYLGYTETVDEAFNLVKDGKEGYIKELANQFKSKLSEKSYNALMNYKVEITD